MHPHCLLALSLFGSCIAMYGCGSDSNAGNPVNGCAPDCSDGGGARDGAGGGTAGNGASSPGGASAASRAGNGGTASGGRGQGGTTATGGTTSPGTGGIASGSGGTATDASTSDGATTTARPGWNLVAIDTARRTYLDYVDVPASGVWTPEGDHFPALATWENQAAYTAVRFQPYAPGDVLTPAQIMALLPATRPATRSISITDDPYKASPAPADATQAIQKALDDAAALANATTPVDVLVPPGVYDYSAVLRVGADVRLRRFPEDTGGSLHATNPANAAVHLAGDRSGALFLVLNFGATARDTTPQSSGIWVGGSSSTSAFVHDVLVVGNEVAEPASAHVFGIAEEGGTWAFNFAHDGYADTFHHTGGSRYCQVVGNRAKTAANRGDDLYAFVSYQADGDVVHHSACIANWGRDGAARGLSVVGGGFILLDHNDIDRTQWAGVYLARENSYQTYGVFDVTVTRNSVSHANLGGSHDGLLAYADAPGDGHDSATFGSVSNQVRRITVSNNTFSNTAAGVGNGFGVEIRSSVDTGEVTNNVLSGNAPPELVVNGTNFTTSGNQIN